MILTVIYFLIFKIYYLNTSEVYNSEKMILKTKNWGCITSPQNPLYKFRNFDGYCNNFNHPHWGQAVQPFARLLPATYEDGIKKPKTNNRPIIREISFNLFPQKNEYSKILTLSMVGFGQLFAHDLGGSIGSNEKLQFINCGCTQTGKLISSSSSRCLPIKIPSNDPNYKEYNYECINYIRTLNTLDVNMTSQNKYADQINGVTSFLDLSVTFGNSLHTYKKIKFGKFGKLKSSTILGNEYMYSSKNKFVCQYKKSENRTCFEGGDDRINQNPQLTVSQTVFLRLFNQIAYRLSKLNPHWTNLNTFLNARRIVIAIYSSIVYNEMIPLLIGEKYSREYKITYGFEYLNYVNDYNSSVDPTVLNEFSNSAFRHIHTLAISKINLLAENRSLARKIYLANYYNRPQIIIGTNFDRILRGMTTQICSGPDEYYVKGITVNLFRYNQTIGKDLRSIDLQRDRDHGLPSYNQMRKFCNLPVANKISDFLDYIEEERVVILEKIYKSPDDVELSVGASLEAPIDDAVVGPTFRCIMAIQFYRTRVGDRYFFETGDPNLRFTLTQLKQIRKIKLADLIVSTSNSISSMQNRAFIKLSKKNPLLKNYKAKTINLHWFKDLNTTGNGDFPVYLNSAS